MTIAEALQEQAKAGEKIAQLRSNLAEAATKYTDQNAFFVYDDVVAELQKMLEHRDNLTQKIRAANNNNFVDGLSLSEIFLLRNRKIEMKGIYESTINTIRTIARGTFRTNDEPKQEVLVDRADIQNRINVLAEEISDLNTKLQKANWQIDI